MSSKTHMGTIRTVFMVGLATLAFTCWGYIWYATIFDDIWQDLIGQSENALIVMAETRGASQTIMTYVISLIQVLGLYFVQRLTKAKTFIDYQTRGLIVSLFLVVPALGNAVLFAGSSEKLWVLDSLHFILGYAGIMLVFWLWQSFFGRSSSINR